MRQASDVVGGLLRAVFFIAGLLFLLAGEDLHSWLVGLGIMVAPITWDVATLVSHSREQTVLLTAITEHN